MNVEKEVKAINEITQTLDDFSGDQVNRIVEYVRSALWEKEEEKRKKERLDNVKLSALATPTTMDGSPCH